MHIAFLQTKVKLMNRSSCSSSSSSSSSSTKSSAKASSNVQEKCSSAGPICDPKNKSGTTSSSNSSGSSCNPSSVSSTKKCPCQEAADPNAPGSVPIQASIIACTGDKKNTNAVGRLGHPNFFITAAPYVLKSCDQVILIDGMQTFIEDDDYKNRKPQVFTISAYAINQFANSTPSSLNAQILMDDLVTVPIEIPGAPRCLKFEKKNKHIVMCFNQNQKMAQIMKAYEDFMKCRLGQGITKEPEQPLKLFKLFQEACMKRKEGGKSITEENYMKYLSKQLPSIADVALESKKNKFKNLQFNPAFGLKTPGVQT